MISLRVFDKQEGVWKLKYTASCNDKWNITSEDKNQNIYCGTFNETFYSTVLIGDLKSRVINLKDSHMNAWYYMSDNPYLSITGLRLDGKKEIWQPSSE